MDYIGWAIVLYAVVKPTLLGEIAAKIKRGYDKQIAEQERTDT